MRIEDLEIVLVSDGVFRVDAGGAFGLVPRALYSRYHRPADDNTVAMLLTCLFVRSRGLAILIDTGLGDKLDPEERARWGLSRPEGGLVQGLKEVGVTPEEVQIVVNTHLHWDHCGGNTRRTQKGMAATFPNAEYWVQRLEWAEACHPDARTRGTYLADHFAPLMAEGRLRLLHGDTPITDQVRCVMTRGHTRGHQSVLFEVGEWRGLYVADMASFAVHMTHPSWVTSFDAEPLENIRTKQHWQRWAIETGAWLFFEHDPKMIAGRLVERAGRVECEPVDVLD
jgi:glyoxylase-like metal-dependent hydrolase (beta-lactamase superfamily II)